MSIMRFKSSYCFSILLLVVLLLSSCGVNKQSNKYANTKVTELSEKLRIPIDYSDKNIPLYQEVSAWLGVPYRYAGNTKKGTDCSGFVSEVYYKLYGIRLERSSDGQAAKNVKKVSKKKLQTGDLVFFKTSKKSKKINHVGIYLKDGRFIHASTSKGVVVSDLDQKYYQNTWVKGGRIK